MEKFKVVIIEDCQTGIKGNGRNFRHEIPNAEVIGTAMARRVLEADGDVHARYGVRCTWGLGGSTTIGVEICAVFTENAPELKVLIFTGRDSATRNSGWMRFGLEQ